MKTLDLVWLFWGFGFAVLRFCVKYDFAKKRYWKTILVIVLIIFLRPLSYSPGAVTIILLRKGFSSCLERL
jgi:hypothetical protein